jgi:hypothetical protein
MANAFFDAVDSDDGNLLSESDSDEFDGTENEIQKQKEFKQLMEQM